MLLLEQGGNLLVDLITLDVAVLDRDIPVLDPRASAPPSVLVARPYGLLDGVSSKPVSEWRSTRLLRLRSCVPLPPLLPACFPSCIWPKETNTKHEDRDAPLGFPTHCHLRAYCSIARRAMPSRRCSPACPSDLGSPRRKRWLRPRGSWSPVSAISLSYTKRFSPPCSGEMKP
jgi:hypothetical protein